MPLPHGYFSFRIFSDVNVFSFYGVFLLFFLFIFLSFVRTSLQEGHYRIIIPGNFLHIFLARLVLFSLA